MNETLSVHFFPPQHQIHRHVQYLTLGAEDQVDAGMRLRHALKISFLIFELQQKERIDPPNDKRPSLDRFVPKSDVA
jgi:hypothetical protein